MIISIHTHYEVRMWWQLLSWCSMLDFVKFIVIIVFPLLIFFYLLTPSTRTLSTTITCLRCTGALIGSLSVSLWRGDSNATGASQLQRMIASITFHLHILFYICIFLFSLHFSLLPSLPHFIKCFFSYPCRRFFTPFFLAIFYSIYLYSYSPSMGLPSLLFHTFPLLTTSSSHVHYLMQRYYPVSFEVLTVLAEHPVAGASVTTEGMCHIKAVIMLTTNNGF